MSNRHIADEGYLGQKLPLVEHLRELRSRLLICIVSITLLSAASFALWPIIFPLLLSRDISLIYISPQEALIVKMKLSLLCGFLLSLPLILFEIWKFVVPGLTHHERKLFLFFGMLSALLFFSGIYFSIFMVTPVMVRFFLGFSQPSLTPLFSIANYSSFLINMTLAFALISQIPILMMLVVAADIISRESIARYRGAAVVFIFIIAAIITPPDAFSQVVLALPMWGLYELGLILTKFIKKKRQEI